LLGTGSSDPAFSAVPAQVTALNNIQSIVFGDIHLVALKNDGTVVAFGNGGSGQLGNGTNNSSLVPVTVSGLTGVTQVTANALGSMALKADGTVWVGRRSANS
jgi:alpha-tubulin suppressor-like RCC1 family protein